MKLTKLFRFIRHTFLDIWSFSVWSRQTLTLYIVAKGISRNTRQNNFAYRSVPLQRRRVTTDEEISRVR